MQNQRLEKIINKLNKRPLETAYDNSNLNDIISFIKTIRKYNLNIQQLHLLLLIAKYPDISGRKLSDASGISQSMISIFLKGLTERLVETKTDPSDKRALIINLTEYGKEFVEQIVKEDAIA